METQLRESAEADTKDGSPEEDGAVVGKGSSVPRDGRKGTVQAAYADKDPRQWEISRWDAIADTESVCDAEAEQLEEGGGQEGFAWCVFF